METTENQLTEEQLAAQTQAAATTTAPSTETTSAGTETTVLPSFLSALSVTPKEEKQPSIEELKAAYDAALKEKADLEAKFQEYETSEAAKILKSGLTLEQIAQGITKVDYSNYSIEGLIKLELEKSGLSGEELENAYNTELEAYQSQSPLAKKNYEKALKENYKTEIKYDEASQLLDKVLKENAEKYKQFDPKVQAQAKEKLMQADLAELDRTFEAIKKTHDLQPEVMEAIKSFYHPDAADALYSTQDGKFNVNQFIEDAYMVKFGKQMMQTAVQEAEKRGYEKAKAEFTNPSMANLGTGGVNSGLTVEQQLQMAIQERLGIKSNQ